MRKTVYSIIFLVVLNSQAKAQPAAIDSLLGALEKAGPDTSRVNLLLTISQAYYFVKPATSLVYSKRAIEEARSLRFHNGLLAGLNMAGEASRLMGDYPASLKYQLEALEIAGNIKDRFREASCLGYIGVTYIDLKEYRQALNYLLAGVKKYKQPPATPYSIFVWTNAGIAYDFLNKTDSALYYLEIAYQQIKNIPHPQLKVLIMTSLGNVYSRIGKNDTALAYYHAALYHSNLSNETINSSRVQYSIANLHAAGNNWDSAKWYALNAFSAGKKTAQKSRMLDAAALLVKIYRVNRLPDSAFFYNDIATGLKDSVDGTEKVRQLQLLMLNEQKKQQEVIQQQQQYKNKIRYLALLSAAAVLLIVGLLLFRNNKLQQKAKSRIEKAYGELKETQAQLIQREKMASLGELTAGIAHEIQNPLNFVNNFSEVNKELIEEMQQELKKGSMADAIAISENIKDNEEKILQHGKRADAIVKSMLQHSRSGSESKELTDINALADEYLRLAYHGLRAKDKSFNARLETDFDPGLPLVKVMPRDLGRAILNIINNAFYAARGTTAPIIILKTKRSGDKVEITIKDNGPGISPAILDKIFQPFYTTKPAGAGTGLGLSLAYDIITKVHNGAIRVNTQPGEGSEFIISLPL